jgi:NTE family protein
MSLTHRHHLCDSSIDHANEADWVCNPLTGRRIKKGSENHKHLIHEGIFRESEEPFMGFVGETITKLVLDPRPEYLKFYNEQTDFFNYSQVPLESKRLDIRGASFTGGGAKGLVYAGVLKALEKRGVLQNLNDLGGSSAGAITAVLVGTLAGLKVNAIRKIRLDRLLEIISETNFEMFFDTNFTDSLKPEVEKIYNPFGLKSRVAQVAVSPIALPLGFASQVLKAVLYMPAKVGQLVKSIHDVVKKGGVYSGQTFLWWMRNTLNEFLGLPKYDEDIPDTIVSFKRYYELTGVNLTITATEVNTNRTVYFGPDTHPDVEVASAVRASMSLPGIFRSQTIVTDEGSNEYIDGGTYDNYPLSSFDIYDEQNDLKAYNTKVIGFIMKSPEDKYGSYTRSEDLGVGDRVATLSSLHDILHKERRVGADFWLRSCFLDIFAEEDEIAKIAETLGYTISPQDQLQIRKDGGLTIGTTEFGLPDYKKRIMIQKGYEQTLEYLDWIFSRMEKTHHGFNLKKYLLSPKYRERVIDEHIDEVCVHSPHSFDTISYRFYQSESELGVPSVFDGMEPSEIRASLRILKLEIDSLSSDRVKNLIQDLERANKILKNPATLEIERKVALSEFNQILSNPLLRNYNDKMVKYKALSCRLNDLGSILEGGGKKIFESAWR